MQNGNVTEHGANRHISYLAFSYNRCLVSKFSFSYKFGTSFFVLEFCNFNKIVCDTISRDSNPIKWEKKYLVKTLLLGWFSNRVVVWKIQLSFLTFAINSSELQWAVTISFMRYFSYSESCSDDSTGKLKILKLKNGLEHHLE